MKIVLQSVIVFAFFTLILCGLYPFVVTSIGQIFFKDKAVGQLQVFNSEVRGSLLLAQEFKSEKYFWPRPSAAQYNGAASSGSNWALIDKRLQDLMETQKQRGLSDGMLTQSASGLDPHISVSSAEGQVMRVAEARKIDGELLKKLIVEQTEKRDWGFLGNERVNVLKLNLALEKL